MIEGIALMPLIVKNYQKAIDFYCGILGFKDLYRNRIDLIEPIDELKMI